MRSQSVMWCCEGRDRQDSAQGSILFSILNSGSQCARTCADTTAAHRLCSHVSKTKTVHFRSPHLVFKTASDVLVKTFRFVKSVQCFRGLPAEDQLRLVRGSWAPLLVLGLVQDSVRLDTTETQQTSLLHKILTQREGDQRRDPGVPADDVERVNTFLDLCRGMRISVQEFAFLKGVILFTSDATELECRDYIQALQKEAERALYQHVRTVHRCHPSRFGQLRVILITLRSLDPDAVAGLFFRPVTGTTGVDEHVLAMFFERYNPRERTDFGLNDRRRNVSE